MFRRLADFGSYVIGDTYSDGERGPEGPAWCATSPPSGATRPFDTLLDIVIADDLRTVLWPSAPDGDDAQLGAAREVVGRPDVP